MPGVPGITERPASLHSGQAIRTDIKRVAQRSDMLMEEQIQLVKDTQDALQRALLEFEVVRSPQDVDFHRTRVQELKQHADENVIILQVANKLNNELMHARHMLRRALKEGLDPNGPRKRVVWLEDRMQHVCWHGQPRSFSRLAQQKQKEDKSSTLSPTKSIKYEHTEKPIVRQDSSPRKFDAGYMPDYSTAATTEPPSLSETDDPAHLPRVKQVRLESSDTTVPDRAEHTHKRRKHRKDLVTQDSFNSEPITPRKSKSEPAMKPSVHGSRGRSQDMTRGTEVTLYPISMYSEDTLTREPTILSSIIDSPTSSYTKESRDASFIKADTGHSFIRGDTSDSATRASQEVVPGNGDTTMLHDKAHEKQFNGVEKSRPVTSESSRPDIEITSIQQHTQDASPQPPIFMTEDTMATRGHSRVTFKESESDDEVLSVAEDDDMDESDKYWQSEHHRFDYGEHSLALLKINPLSYHQMGLAVPGTFVDEVKTELTELPWRPTKKGEILDIHSYTDDKHRRALDKLHVKVQKMYKKVEEAALMSVNVHNYTSDSIHRSASYLLRNMEVTSTRGDTPSSVKSATSSSRPASRPKTQDAIVLPPLLKIDKAELAEDSSSKGKLIYYPTPLLHPELLPVTRTNKSKHYPRLPKTFGESRPDVQEPAERITNQGKLYKDTKMKLYKGRTKARTVNRREGEYVRRKANTEDSYDLSSRSPDTIQHLTLRPDSRNLESPDKEGFVGWKSIKPKSGALEHSGIKWERIKGIVHTNIESPRKEERRDAVQQLGTMQGGDTMVMYALKERMEKDEDDEVKYEAVKSLIMLGCWDEEVLVSVVKYLMVGNYEIKTDLLHAMIHGKNVQHINKDMEIFPLLLELLSHMCKNPDINDSVSFDAAVCIGKMCIADENAKEKLRKVLFYTPDSHIKAQALDILVKQLKCTDRPIIHAVLMQMVKSPVWKYRVDAARCLAYIGPRHICMDTVFQTEVYNILETRLWDEPNREVRFEMARSMTTLGMLSKAQERTMKRLDDHREEVRSQAVICIGTLGIRNEKTIRALLEMLELDASEYVRLMIIRTFAILGLTDKRIIHTLKEREKSEGPLARASSKALVELGKKNQSAVAKG